MKEQGVQSPMSAFLSCIMLLHTHLLYLHAHTSVHTLTSIPTHTLTHPHKQTHAHPHTHTHTHSQTPLHTQDMRHFKDMLRKADNNYVQQWKIDPTLKEQLKGCFESALEGMQVRWWECGGAGLLGAWWLEGGCYC